MKFIGAGAALRLSCQAQRESHKTTHFASYGLRNTPNGSLNDAYWGFQEEAMKESVCLEVLPTVIVGCALVACTPLRRQCILIAFKERDFHERGSQRNTANSLLSHHS